MISEDRIMKHLDFHLSQSDPGDMLHHLSILRAASDAVGPLGTLDDEKVNTHFWAIAAQGPGTAEDLIATAIKGALYEAIREHEMIVLAVLSQEMWVVPEKDADYERIMAENSSLGNHPKAFEVTAMYAACADGRRWRGRRYLTGGKAGTTEDVELIVGQPQRGESRAISAEGLIRRMVGMSS